MIERFVRGLAVGSLLGAMFAGWMFTRRKIRARDHQSTTEASTVPPGSL